MGSERKRIWGWWAFDWANQPYNTLLLTFIFAPYFAASVAPDPVSGQAMWGWMLAISGLLTAFFAPILGAIADNSGFIMSSLCEAASGCVVDHVLSVIVVE